MEPSKPNTTVQNAEITSKPKERSRVGATWISLVIFLAILIAMIVFILQNSKDVQVSYLGAKGTVSFGVAMIIAAIAGAVLTVLIGSLRIVQLKLKNRRESVT